MLSVLFVTWNRGKISPNVLIENLERTTSGGDIELLMADQGSTDREIIDLYDDLRCYVAGHPLRNPRLMAALKHANVVTVHMRRNRTNEGIGRTLNQLFLRSLGGIVFTMGNDLLMPNGWDTEMLGYARGVPNVGIVGMDWGHGGTPPVTASKDGHIAKWLTPELDRIFGPMMMRRTLIQEIGFFHEGFHPYGFEDSDFNARVNIAGFRSCYVPNMRCEHIGVGEHDRGEYRAMKDASMGSHTNLLGERLNGYAKTGIIEPLPPHREPL